MHLIQCIHYHITAFQAAESAVQQLEQKLLDEGTNWRLQFLRAKRAPQESFSEQFKQLARFTWCQMLSAPLYAALVPACAFDAALHVTHCCLAWWPTL